MMTELSTGASLATRAPIPLSHEHLRGVLNAEPCGRTIILPPMGAWRQDGLGGQL